MKQEITDFSEFRESDKSVTGATLFAFHFIVLL